MEEEYFVIFIFIKQMIVLSMLVYPVVMCCLNKPFKSSSSEINRNTEPLSS